MPSNHNSYQERRRDIGELCAVRKMYKMPCKNCKFFRDPACPEIRKESHGKPAESPILVARRDIVKGIAEVIRHALLRRKTSQTALADRLGTTVQNFNNKLRRESFSDEEMRKIASALNATFFAERAWLKLNDTGEEIRPAGQTGSPA